MAVLESKRGLWACFGCHSGEGLNPATLDAGSIPAWQSKSQCGLL